MSAKRTVKVDKTIPNYNPDGQLRIDYWYTEPHIDGANDCCVSEYFEFTSKVERERFELWWNARISDYNRNGWILYSFTTKEVLAKIFNNDNFLATESIAIQDDKIISYKISDKRERY